MNPQPIYVLCTIISSFIHAILAYQSWQRQHIVGARAFTLIGVSFAWWGFFYTLELISQTVPEILAWQKLEYVGIVMFPVAWLLFTIFYSGVNRVRFRTLLGLSLIPTATIAVAWTNEWHHLFWQQAELRLIDGFHTVSLTYGPWFYVHLIYSYVLCAVGVYILLRTLFRSVTRHRQHTLIMLTAILVPVFANILSFEITKEYLGFDITVIAFSISGLLIARGLLRLGILDSPPIAYDTIIASLPSAVVVVDKDHRVMSGNSMLERYIARPVDDIMNQPVLEVLPELSFIDLQADGTVTHSGKLKQSIVDVIVSPLTTETQRSQGRVIVIRDMTESKRIEQTLLATERRYRALFDHSNDAIFITDLEQSIILTNEQAEALLQIPQSEIVQHNLTKFIAADQIDIQTHYVQKLRDGQTVPLYELDLQAKDDDNPIPTEFHMTLVRDEQGEPAQIQMIVRDITERKQGEAALQARIEDLTLLGQIDAEMTSTLKLEQVVQFALMAFTGISGANAGFIAMTEGESLCIRRVKGAYPETMIGRRLQFDVGIVGRVIVNQEAEWVPNVEADEDYVPELEATVSVITVPLISQDRLIGVINLETDRQDAFNADIFHFMKLLASRIAVALDNALIYELADEQLAELQTLYEEVTRLESTKTQMIRIATHDLKNPLSVISGYLNMLDMDRDLFDPMYVTFFDQIRKSVVRMETLLNDILSLERIQQQASGDHHETFSLNKQVLNAVTEHAEQATQKSQHLEVDLHSSDLIVKGDQSQIYEAVSNLITNAIKYTPENGHIIVRLLNDAENVIFEVEDDGYGIPEERQAKLFEAFYRAKAEGTENIEGTGLGLHLVKSIIERHAGSIHFQSVYGEGSTFGFQLPAVKNHEDRSPANLELSD